MNDEVKRSKQNYCPVNDYECPYWSDEGICTLEHVEEECEDFIFWRYTVS